MPHRLTGLPVLVFGGGELGTAVAQRLQAVAMRVLVVERAEATAVCRAISLAAAVHEGQVTVEDVVGVRVDGILLAEDALERGEVPVMVAPTRPMLTRFGAGVAIDATYPAMSPAELPYQPADGIVRLGPGRTAGEEVFAVVDTGLHLGLGRVLYSGRPVAGTEPSVGLHAVLEVRAEGAGIFVAETEIGAPVREGDQLGLVGRYAVEAPRAGYVRGLLADGLTARAGQRVAELWLGGDAAGCYAISPWARSVAGGALEAVVRLVQ